VADLDTWIGGGRRLHLRLGGAERGIFARVGEAAPGAAWCTLLHGFPTSSFDWHRVWDALGARRCLLAFDFLGFGDSDKPADHDYSIHEQADLTELLWERHGIVETAIVTHDYGVSVAQELLARHLEGRLRTRLERVVFLNGGLYPELHRPQPGQLLLLDPKTGPEIAKLVGEETFSRSLLPTFAPGHPPSAAELHAAWRSVERRDGHRIGHRLIRYIHDRQRHRDRWVGALETAPLPRSFVWGMLDPVSGAHMAEGIAHGLPAAEIVRLEDVGHWPQLEAPEAVAGHLLRMLGASRDLAPPARER
jgi:pimeloyl-ACP methyl ester carboxylesterase